MTMRTRFTFIPAAAAALALAACASTNATPDASSASAGASGDASADAATSVEIGGAEMLSTNNLVQNVSLSADHTTLVSALEGAGLTTTLSGPGPYTLFAPNNAAFGLLGQGTVDQLMQPAAKAQLARILSYHVVPQRLTAEDIQSAIESGGGSASLTTVQGDPLEATLSSGNIMLTDTRGGTSYVIAADAVSSNGVLHVVNAVLVPQPPAQPAAQPMTNPSMQSPTTPSMQPTDPSMQSPTDPMADPATDPQTTIPDPQ